MNTLVTKEAPDFTAKAVMPDNSFNTLSLSSLRGKHVVLFFYPLDFTFVCPTEIIAFDKALQEFQKRNTEVVGISVDSEFTHLAWKNTARAEGGIGQIKYPLVSDLTKDIAREYGVLTEGGVALRGLFLLDRDGIIRHQVVNDLGLGRSVREVLRMLDALQHLEEYGEVCPANWEAGLDALQPTADGVARYLAEHTSD